MGFYQKRILPYLFDWSLSAPIIGKYRQEVLASVSGEVLEIGFGTGLNLSYYPDDIYKIVTVDPNPGVHVLAQKRVKASSIMVEHQIISGENLPMTDNSFDNVVSTFTLCSIANVEQALKEVYRVLKPGGGFHFLEHGLSREPKVQLWQNRLTPLQKIIGDGCHFNRNIRQLVETQFQNVQLEEFYLENEPKISGYLYKGVGYKAI